MSKIQKIRLKTQYFSIKSFANMRIICKSDVFSRIIFNPILKLNDIGP